MLKLFMNSDSGDTALIQNALLSRGWWGAKVLRLAKKGSETIWADFAYQGKEFEVVYDRETESMTIGRIK